MMQQICMVSGIRWVGHWAAFADFGNEAFAWTLPNEIESCARQGSLYEFG
jgi:hypothetical protein